MSKFQALLKHAESSITPENLKLLYDELVQMKNISYLEKYEEQCKEVIQYIIEYLIYSDKNDPTIFDLFCEYNFMNEFIYLANMNNRGINLQIIKSFALLILNLTNTTTLYFIFSNNFINMIISNDYERYDEDFLSYFVNFMKSLSLKIDSTTIQFFFNRQMNKFPLIESAMKMYNHSDPMIKNVVRNIILTIMKINYEPIVEYFSCLPSITYFVLISCRIRDLVIKMNEEIMSDDQLKLKMLHDEIIDDVLYVQDIFSLKLKEVNYILCNCLLYYFILPLLCGTLISMTKPMITMSVSLYMIQVLFHFVKDESFLNILFSVIFSEKLSKKIIRYIEEFPKPPIIYTFDWNPKKYKNTVYSFYNFVTYNFSEQFIKSLILMSHSPYYEVQAIVKKFDNIFEDKETLVNTHSQNSTFIQSILEEVLAKFTNTEIDLMTSYHKNISLATGVNVGLTLTDHKRDSVMTVMERFYAKMKNKDDINRKFLKNEVRENVLSYLKSKDDTLILLVNLIINSAHRKNVSQELLSQANLLRASEFPKAKSDTNRILAEIFSQVSSDGNMNLSSKKGLISFFEDPEPEKTDYVKNEAIMTTNLIEFENINTPSPSQMLNSSSPTLIMTSKNGDTVNSNFLPISFANFFFRDSFPAIEQTRYDSELVDSLFNLLMIEPPLRLISNRVILDNLKSLIIKDEGVKSEIEQNHIEIINKTYYTFLSNIKLILMNNKYIRETGYEHFDNEWNNYRAGISAVVNEIVSKPYILIPFNLEDDVEDYPKCLTNQKTDLDTFKTCLILFMTIHDLRQYINQEKSVIKNDFPLKFGGFELTRDKSYNLLNIGVEMYTCKMKTNAYSQFINYTMVMYQNFLYFAVTDPLDSHLSIIRSQYPLRYIEAQIDRNDTRNLILVLVTQKKYSDVLLGFDDASKALQVKKKLEDYRKSARSTEYRLLESYFDGLISNWTIY